MVVGPTSAAGQHETTYKQNLFYMKLVTKHKYTKKCCDLISLDIFMPLTKRLYPRWHENVKQINIKGRDSNILDEALNFYICRIKVTTAVFTM